MNNNDITSNFRIEYIRSQYKRFETETKQYRKVLLEIYLSFRALLVFFFRYCFEVAAVSRSSPITGIFNFLYFGKIARGVSEEEVGKKYANSSMHEFYPFRQ
ncbi:hypothetical protein CEXT_629411 [Caerostris extrusa]|uniref:Uncharacterized protein n=1 Tax=Caerostris extrusa TaxID=172846 RepID=A0AAV4TQJ6_CAEEX|nr:hypothetical protein CEXT_629411 [Caerostris extrusa]